MKTLLHKSALILGITNSVALGMAWLSAAMGDGTVKIRFNDVGEMWLEGVLIGLSIPLLLWVAIRKS